MNDDSTPREPKDQDYSDGRGGTNIPPALSSSSREYFRDDAPINDEDVPPTKQEQRD